jgi:23S rRNA A2030 N6-methylase RlmJ
MFASSEKVGKVQRLDGHSSQEEYKLEATVGQKNGQIDKGGAELEQNKNENRIKDDLIQNCVPGWLSAQDWKLRKTTTKKSSNE